MKNVLSKRQTDTLNAIRDHIKRTGIPASRKELQVALGLRSQAGVDRLLDALARKKYVQIHPGVDRGLRLLREGAPIVDTDELPRVAAGPPTVACDQPEPARLHDYDSVADQFSERPDWFVRADGDSIDKIYQNGDVLAVKRNPNPRNGDIVVARIGEEATVKVFHRTGSSVELRPASHNPEHKPIQITKATTDFEIVGVVVGAIVGARRDTKH